MARKEKKKLDKEWEDRKVHYLSMEDKKGQRYCLHAWSTFDSDGHGQMVTHCHDFARTDAGWSKAESKAREYVDAGYTVSITKTGSM